MVAASVMPLLVAVLPRVSRMLPMMSPGGVSRVMPPSMLRGRSVGDGTMEESVSARGLAALKGTPGPEHRPHSRVGALLESVVHVATLPIPDRVTVRHQ